MNLRATIRIASPSQRWSAPSTLLLATGTVAVAFSVPAVGLRGDGAILFDNAQQVATVVGVAVALLLAVRDGHGGQRHASAGLAASLVVVGLGMVVWDLQPGGSTSISPLADALLVGGTAIGLLGLVPPIFGPLDRAGLWAAVLDAAILFLTGVTLVEALWQSDLAFFERIGAMPSLLAAAALIGGAAAGLIALLARRIPPGVRGPWAVIGGLLAVGLAWIGWFSLTVHGGANHVSPTDFLFSAGVLMIGYGGATWNDVAPPSGRYERIAQGIGDLFPILAVLLAIGLALIVAPSTRPPGTVEVSAATVVLVAVSRQALLNVQQRRARESERRAAARLEHEIHERAATLASLSRLEPRESPEATAEMICREALTLDGIDVAIVRAFNGAGEVVVLAQEGLGAGASELVRPPMPARRALFAAGRAAGHPWIDRAVSGADPWLNALHEDGLRGVASAALRWDDRLIGAVSLGTRAAASAGMTARPVSETLEDRLPTVSEFAVVAAALIGPALAAGERQEAVRKAIGRIIDDREFWPVFQPIVELATGRIVGFEALTRFADGARADRRFGEAAAARMGIALERACLQVAIESSEALPPEAWISLNVSPELATALLPLVSLLENLERPVVLEITEHVPVTDYARLVDALGTLQGHVRLAVDDAGAGYAGLRHILEVRPHFVKLDIALVRSVDSDPARRAMVGSMATFTADTGCLLIAEGIETPGELEALRALGVPLGQGYLLGMPEPIAPSRWAAHRVLGRVGGHPEPLPTAR